LERKNDVGDKNVAKGITKIEIDHTKKQSTLLMVALVLIWAFNWERGRGDVSKLRAKDKNVGSNAQSWAAMDPQYYLR